jgi:hypothetical protein
MPSKSEKRSSPTFIDQLTATPIRNEKAVARVTERATLRVSVPQSYPAWVRPIANTMHLRGEKSYELEGVGRRVFDRVDGETSVENLVDWLAAEHRLSFHESRVLIMKYLQMLMEHGLIVIAGATREPPP